MADAVGKGLLETVYDLADGIQRKTCGRWPRSVRLAISIFWDFCIDIPLRLLSWPLDFVMPGFIHIARAGLDVILTFFGIALWGRTGLLQILEGIWNLIPGVDWLVDLIPMLTIAGFVAKDEPAEGQVTPDLNPPSSTAKQGGSGMSGFLVGFLVGLVGWLFGIASLKWIPVAALVGGFIVPIFRRMSNMEMPARVVVAARWTAVVAGILLATDLLAYFATKSVSPEKYRGQAWQQTVAEGDLRLKAAASADSVKEKVTKALPSTEGLWKKSKEALRKSHKGFGIPFLDQVKEDFLKPSEETPKQEGQQEPEGQPEESSAMKKKVEELKLGPVQAKLYFSNYTLDRAKKIQQEKLDLLANIGITLGILLGVSILIILSSGATPNGAGPVTTTSGGQDNPLGFR